MNRPVFYAKVEEGDSSAQHGSSQRKADQPTSPNSNKDGQGLFAAHKKIFMREVSGKFNNLRWLFVWLTQLLYFVIPWLKWNDRPAVWFDLEKRFFYIFGWTFSPTDVIYMTIVLIICALALFSRSTSPLMTSQVITKRVRPLSSSMLTSVTEAFSGVSTWPGKRICTDFFSGLPS